jgi:hypothetical protein
MKILLTKIMLPVHVHRNLPCRVYLNLSNNTALKCGSRPTSKVDLVRYILLQNCQPPVGLGLNCALKRSKKIFGGFWAQNTTKMKREVRRIHWYTAGKEKTNHTKVIKDQTYCIFL